MSRRNPNSCTSPPFPYHKPFNFFYYNKPKPQPLPQRKKIDLSKEPKIPIQHTYATKLKKRATETALSAKKPVIHYADLTEKSFQKATIPPKVRPRQTKTYQYRYKMKRDIPVVSCRFTEHVMMYRKPPFTVPNTKPHCGGLFKIPTSSFTHKF